MVHRVADILIYLYVCVCEEGEMCRKTSKRGSHLKRKKKKKIEAGAATSEKNDYFGA